jgi:hypothetical protein
LEIIAEIQILAMLPAAEKKRFGIDKSTLWYWDGNHTDDGE